MVAIDYNPVALGYVTSLARPTGDVTGLYFEQIELAAKRIDLLKDAFPATRAVTVFWDTLLGRPIGKGHARVLKKNSAFRLPGLESQKLTRTTIERAL